MPTRCDRLYLLQILLHAQHVSGNTMPIILFPHNNDDARSKSLQIVINVFLICLRALPVTCIM